MCVGGTSAFQLSKTIFKPRAFSTHTSQNSHLFGYTQSAQTIFFKAPDNFFQGPQQKFRRRWRLRGTVSTKRHSALRKDIFFLFFVGHFNWLPVCQFSRRRLSFRSPTVKSWSAKVKKID
eukprot:Trichotokara_eunicae@DN6556_c0_g1_i1.p1